VNSPLETKILEIFEASGAQWLRPRDIARRLGRRRQLTPYDTRVVKRLLDEGLIDRRPYRIGPERESYLYRLHLDELDD
jgi:DNA-binding MarR family transcriptional regulator